VFNSNQNPTKALDAALDANSQGHGATLSKGHDARETERTTGAWPASDRPRGPEVAIERVDRVPDEIFAGSRGQRPGRCPATGTARRSLRAALFPAGK
jgi:hypothetical protein